ncbi:MAG: DUF393 domain-containing protein [Paludibacteraceae bacterium]|nr:DUF393 domain-containing protein [Paludibacteraceae bacterium]
MPTTASYSIILFDGMCYACSFVVRLILLLDRKKHFRFAPLQSDIGTKLSSSYAITTPTATILFISQGNCYTKSTAILEIFKILGGIWLLLLIFRYIPLRVRDKLYDWIAKNRYKLFGKRTTCSIPPPRYQDRFLK